VLWPVCWVLYQGVWVNTADVLWKNHIGEGSITKAKGLSVEGFGASRELLTAGGVDRNQLVSPCEY